jgi:hypothetical protein
MKLTPTQKEALRRIVRVVRRMIKAGYTQREVAEHRFPYGAGTDFTRPTIRAMQNHGLVVAHTGPVSKRPSRAGFGRPANARTIVEANRWFTMTPRLSRILLKEE